MTRHWSTGILTAFALSKNGLQPITYSFYKATRQIRRKEQSSLSYPYRSALLAAECQRGYIANTSDFRQNFRRVVCEIEGYTRKFAKTLFMEWIILGQ